MLAQQAAQMRPEITPKHAQIGSHSPHHGPSGCQQAASSAKFT
jgi:hypothetical protein